MRTVERGPSLPVLSSVVMATGDAAVCACHEVLQVQVAAVTADGCFMATCPEQAGDDTDGPGRRPPTVLLALQWAHASTWGIQASADCTSCRGPRPQPCHRKAGPTLSTANSPC